MNQFKKPLEELKSFYSGFFIDKPAGNNAFSYESREQRSIFVPQLIEVSLQDAAIGNEVVFCEIEDGAEKGRHGLENLVYHQSGDKHFFLFDNHNHAFSFWMAALHGNLLKPGLPLIHVDQHSDMRKPDVFFELNRGEDLPDLNTALEYANYTLNVGNFIQPALRLGIFSSVEIIDNSSAFLRLPEPPFAFDLDLDIFSEDMAYISQENKYAYIRHCLKHATVITIATSPYFIDQEAALRHLREILSTWQSDTLPSGPA